MERKPWMSYNVQNRCSRIIAATKPWMADVRRAVRLAKRGDLESFCVDLGFAPATDDTDDDLRLTVVCWLSRRVAIS